MTIITETMTDATGRAKPTSPGRIRVGLITPGWGSSGYYAPDVLEAAAHDRVFPAGTHIYFDHPSASENTDRPERSVRDLAATLTADAVWDGEGLVAEAEVIGPYRELVTDPVFTSAVGMSIRAGAETSVGEAEGREGVIVDRLTEGLSVDLVTRAGRGGRVLEVLESARATAVVEATTDEVRDALQRAAGQGSWVRDHDPDAGEAYMDSDGSGANLRAVPYEYDGTTATLDWANAYPVRAVTRYEPLGGTPQTTPTTEAGAHNPVTPAGTNTKSQEDTMHQIEEGRLAQLEEAAGRVEQAEQTAQEATARAEKAEAALAAERNHNEAAGIIRAVENDKGATFTALESRGLMADLPTGDDGALDTDAFTQTVTAAAEESLTARPTRGYGFGAEHMTTPGDGEVTAADATESALAAFGHTVKEA